MHCLLLVCYSICYCCSCSVFVSASCFLLVSVFAGFEGQRGRGLPFWCKRCQGGRASGVGCADEARGVRGAGKKLGFLGLPKLAWVLGLLGYQKLGWGLGFICFGPTKFGHVFGLKLFVSGLLMFFGFSFKWAGQNWARTQRIQVYLFLY
ncbi:hypothetical protein ES319_A11G301900v1 [Gossypium barbadense]|uniref:Uncharacterized protein n=1 Tax=Gossypium barbadense TaxID=3634 RepID=A0A5J5TV33_GOSBA|nr:hypothetical protein ES319_A11G301900v1 [Gossypium barbadense]